MNYFAAIAMGLTLLLGAISPAQASAELFASHCARCHNDVVAPVRLTYNAAGNPEIIAAANSRGMGATGTPAEHASIAAYLDSTKPTITLAPVAHDSPGTVISLRDITVVTGATFASTQSIVSVSAPTKGTVAYTFGRGFSIPSTVTYRPFPGQSGTDTWTYQGTGSGLSTTVRTASVAIAASATPVVPNYTALYWNPAESGWGLNLSHQGNTLFGTLFTYEAGRAPLWLVMSGGAMQPDGVTFIGDLFRTTGPAFNANPFTPIDASNVTKVGTMTVAFIDVNGGTLKYTVNGVEVTKAIQRQVFGTRAAACVPSTASRATATNYQDLWWNPAESGWGINVTHQDNTLFATLFTYDATGKALWLVMSSGTRQTDGSYLGDLFQTTGPAFNASPFAGITVATVGTMRLAFSDGSNGTLSYTYNGTTVTKSITRQVFSSPVPACN